MTSRKHVIAITTDPTANLLRIVVDYFLESNLSTLWKYFGTLLWSPDYPETRTYDRLWIWSSMLRRRLGTEDFQVVVGAERASNRASKFHVVVGGIRGQRGFERNWCGRWQDLGGSSAVLLPFTSSLLREYLKTVPQGVQFERIMAAEIINQK